MARVFVIEDVDVSSIENVSLDTERCKQNRTHGLSRTNKDHKKFSDSKRSRLFALSAKSRVYKTNNAIKNVPEKRNSLPQRMKNVEIQLLPIL